jgi:uncharacterized protein
MYCIQDARGNIEQREYYATIWWEPQAWIERCCQSCNAPIRHIQGKRAMWIKPFTADGQHYVYSAWTNQIARISPRLHSLFAGNESPSVQGQAAEHLGLLPTAPQPIDLLSDDTIAAGLAEINQAGPTNLVLTVTEACNFRCRYCAYSGSYDYSRQHSNIHMAEATATKAIHWYLRFPRQRYHIGFYGGEPLLRRRLIEKAMCVARENLPAGAELSFGMTSNGWLLDQESVRFLANNCVDLFISLDGPASVHDRHRLNAHGTPTFDRVWAAIKQIRRLNSDYFERHVNFSITLAPPDALTEIEEFVQRNPDIFAGKIPKVGMLNGAPSHVMQSLGVPAGEERIDCSSLRERYLTTMIEGGKPDGFSRACVEPSMASIHSRNMAKTATVRISCGQCTPGVRCHVTPDGRLHMCEHGDEQRPIGNVDSGFDQAAVEAMLKEFRDFVKPRCKECWAVRLCSKCIPQLAAGTTLSDDIFSSLCASRKANLERDLVDYCRARSRNDGCFDSLPQGTAN